MATSPKTRALAPTRRRRLASPGSATQVASSSTSPCASERPYNGTPFGDQLRCHRQRRNLRQLDLATGAKLSAGYVSALESGLKPPPPAHVITDISNALGLNDAQAALLVRAARLSHPIVRVPRGVQAAGYVLANRLAEELPKLSQRHIQLLQDVLELAAAEVAMTG